MTTESTTNDGNDTPERITSAAALLAAYANGRRDFHGADLTRADLTGVLGLTPEQLRTATTTGTRTEADTAQSE